jgi:WD40-like Beta Propeller Repeat
MRPAVPLWFIALGILPALAGGCGSINTDLGDDDNEGGSQADAGPADGGTPDAAPPLPDGNDGGGGGDGGAPACEWSQLTTAPFDMLNTDAFEESPTLTGDAKTMLFTRFSPNGDPVEIFEATRSGPDAPFEDVRFVEELQSEDPEAIELEISADGTEIFFLRSSDTIVSARRASPGATFGEVESTGLLGFSPTLSGDGLSLYFIDTGLTRIRRATRSAIGEPWDDPVDVGPMGLFDSIDVSPDELRLLMSRPGPDAQPVAIASRSALDEPFGAAESAGDVFLLDEDISPFVQADWDASERQIVINFDLDNGNAADLYLSNCE